MVRAISSAIEKSVFLNSSKSMGSRTVLVTRSPQIDDDVAVLVQPSGRPGRDHTGGIVLLHDGGALHRRPEIATPENRRLLPHVLAAEVHAPALGRLAARGLIAVDHDAVRHPR